MAKKQEEEADLTIFGLTTDKDLRVEYPELDSIPEFKGMNKKEVKLCWMIGNRTSPIYNMTPLLA